MLSLKQASEISTAVRRPSNASKYCQRANRTAAAINRHLWNESKQAYGITAASLDVIAQDANVFCILASVAEGQTAKVSRCRDHCELTSKVVLNNLVRYLGHPNGFLAFDRESGYRESISNFVSGWHLLAALKVGAADHADYILSKILAPQAQPEQ